MEDSDNRRYTVNIYIYIWLGARSVIWGALNEVAPRAGSVIFLESRALSLSLTFLRPLLSERNRASKRWRKSSFINRDVWDKLVEKSKQLKVQLTQNLLTEVTARQGAVLCIRLYGTMKADASFSVFLYYYYISYMLVPVLIRIYKWYQVRFFQIFSAYILCIILPMSLNYLKQEQSITGYPKLICRRRETHWNAGKTGVCKTNIQGWSTRLGLIIFPPFLLHFTDILTNRI